jgi:hypothetical protein
LAFASFAAGFALGFDFAFAFTRDFAAGFDFAFAFAIACNPLDPASTHG